MTEKIFDAAYVKEKIASVEHWYHRIEVAPGVLTPGINDSQTFLSLLNIPEDCSNLRVLDLGTRDGFFAFELEKRGAEVVAVDYYPSDKTGFKVASELLNSKVTFVQENIYNVSADKFGVFDVVLFLGLIYHLPDPIRALNIVRSLCKSDLYFETQLMDNAFLMPDGSFTSLASLPGFLSETPLMQFCTRDSLNQDFSNYWVPNLKCMKDMLLECNFLVLESKLHGSRGVFKCRTTDDASMEYHMQIATGERAPEV